MKDLNSMEIYVYENGSKTKLDNSKLDLPQIASILNSLLKNANEYMRLYMDEERFESLKKTEFVVEFINKKEIYIHAATIGELKFRRVMIPLTGDFAGSSENPFVTIFIGAEKYFPEPINNNFGFPDLLKLKKELIDGSR